MLQKHLQKHWDQPEQRNVENSGCLLELGVGPNTREKWQRRKTRREEERMPRGGVRGREKAAWEWTGDGGGGWR